MFDALFEQAGAAAATPTDYIKVSFEVLQLLGAAIERTIF